MYKKKQKKSLLDDINRERHIEKPINLSRIIMNVRSYKAL